MIKKIVKKIYLLIIVAIPCIAKAQMSNHLYHLLPDSLHPKNKADITLQELKKLMPLSAIFYTMDSTSIKELDQLVSSLAHSYPSIQPTAERINFLQLTTHYWYNRYTYGDSSKNRFLDSALIFNKLTRENIGNDTKTYTQDLVSYYYFNGAMLIRLSQYTEAYDNLQNGLMICRTIKNMQKSETIFAILADMYSGLLLYDKAIAYCDSVMLCHTLSGAKKNFSTDLPAITQLIKADLYTKLYATSKQQKYADKTHAITDPIKNDSSYNKSMRCMAFGILSCLSYNEGYYEKSIAYADSLFFLKKDSTYDSYSIYNFGYEGLSLLQLGKVEAGISLLKKIDIQNNMFGIEPVLEQLYHYEKKNGDYNKALAYYEQLTKFGSENKTMQYQGQIFETEQKYNVAEKDLEIGKLNENEKRNKWIAGLVFLVVAFITTIFYIRYKNNKAKAKQLLRQIDELTALQVQQIEDVAEKAKGEERKKLGQDLHDDFSASLASMLQFMRSKSLKEKEPEEKKQMLQAVGILEDSYSRARAKSHEIFHQETADHFWEKLTDNINLFFSGTSVELTLEIDKSGMWMLPSVIKTNILYTIKEAITNILKHAKASMVNILVYCDDDKIYLEIKDNGKGIAKNYSNSNMGLNSIKDRIQKLDGEINIQSSNKGTVIEIMIPLTH